VLSEEAVFRGKKGEMPRAAPKLAKGGYRRQEEGMNEVLKRDE